MKPMDLDDLILRLQLRYIKRALRACDGSRTKAAVLLGLGRTTLVMRIKRLESLGYSV